MVHVEAGARHRGDYQRRFKQAKNVCIIKNKNAALIGAEVLPFCVDSSFFFAMHVNGLFETAVNSRIDSGLFGYVDAFRAGRKRRVRDTYIYIVYAKKH